MGSFEEEANIIAIRPEALDIEMLTWVPCSQGYFRHFEALACIMFEEDELCA